jgi:hypothetical protein
LIYTNILSTALGACHQGAAIEGLCLTGSRRNETSSYNTFYHNVSATDTPNAIDVPGVLGYTLIAGGDLIVPSAMEFSTSPTSNVAVPIFYPGWDRYSMVEFDERGEMYIEAYQDDTVSPPTYYPTPLKVKNWYICVTRWGYTYSTLVWKIGLTCEPQNPSCQKVVVERVWL